MKVGYTSDVLRDFGNIARWAGQDFPSRGAEFVARLSGKCEKLSYQPRRYPAVREVDDVAIHKMVFERYLIFYAISPGEILVLRAVHGATDWATLFDTEAS